MSFGQKSDTTTKQKDIVDVVKQIVPRFNLKKNSNDTLATSENFLWVFPNINYTIATKFSVQLIGNLAYRRPNANISSAASLLTYTQNRQQLVEARVSHWFEDNTYNLIGDWRIMRYPQDSYGLGITPIDSLVNMDYNYLKLHQTLLKQVRPNLYVGGGFLYDYHWNIRSGINNNEITRISNYQKGVSGRSTSSGLSFNIMYDNRVNAINSGKGFYANLVVRSNFKWLGSDNNAEMILVDVRKYINFPHRSDNILAFWSYNNLVINGDIPFLDLPSVGWDTQKHTGRGFIQGRYRSKKMVYLESEYRFGITKNRLLGGVVFANAQTYQEPNRVVFKSVVTSVGVGLRVKINKFSGTNFVVDYAIGSDGSKGVFFSLGETF